MIIAIPVENGRLHNHFGGCRQFALVEVDLDTKRTIRTEVVSASEHQPGLFPRWLRELGVGVVIAGGIGHRALANFAHHGIVVRAGTANGEVAALVAAFLNNQLTVASQGCEHHGHHHDHHHEHGHHDSHHHHAPGVDRH